jgi:hypothetical protein
MCTVSTAAYMHLQQVLQVFVPQVMGRLLQQDVQLPLLAVSLRLHFPGGASHCAPHG